MTRIWIDGKEIEGVVMTGIDFARNDSESTVHYAGLKDISGSFTGTFDPHLMIEWFPELRAIAERTSFILRNRMRRRPQRPGPKHHPRRRHGRRAS